VPPKVHGQVCILFSSASVINVTVWTVVTGASTGIGREYAIQLAKKGFNVLLVARNEQALTAVTDEIGS
jgi:short-subunit dehydrogenase